MKIGGLYKDLVAKNNYKYHNPTRWQLFCFFFWDYVQELQTSQLTTCWGVTFSGEPEKLNPSNRVQKNPKPFHRCHQEIQGFPAKRKDMGTWVGKATWEFEANRPSPVSMFL